MNSLSATCQDLLNQLETVIAQINKEDFIRPSQTLSGSSLGQHIRHTLEFFLCLESGVESGIVNYDNRRHDKELETNQTLALAALLRIRYFVASQKSNIALKFEAAYNRHGSDSLLLDTNYLRELAYNIEHAVHHMAILKIGMHETAPYVMIHDNFGVAASTVRYQAKSTISSIIESQA